MDVVMMALRDPWIVLGASFTLGLLLLACGLLVTSTQRWHDRRHTARGVTDPIGCDHCRRDWYARLDQRS